MIQPETVARDTRRADLAAAAAKVEPDTHLLRSAGIQLRTQIERMISAPYTLGHVIETERRAELLRGFNYRLLDERKAHCELLLSVGVERIDLPGMMVDYISVKDCLQDCIELHEAVAPYRQALKELEAQMRKGGAK